MEENSCVVNEVSCLVLLGITVYRLHNLIPAFTKPINSDDADASSKMFLTV
jgi:hypothetical protein